MIILSAEPDGTGDAYVDDQVTVSVNGQQVYQFDYSHNNSGRIIPNGPVDLTEHLQAFVGQSVEIKIEYSDLFGGSQGSSGFFLVFK